MTNITVIGAGYVGLTTAVGLTLQPDAPSVICADIDAEKVKALDMGIVPFDEPGMETELRRALANGRLRFVTGAADAVVGAQFVFLCLPTPRDADGSADTSAIEDVVTEIAEVVTPDTIIVIRSTVPVGTNAKVSGLTRARVVSQPEFLREGSALTDYLFPDRIVIGCDDPDDGRAVGMLHDRWLHALLIMSPASAEVVKYAANAFLAVKASFANEIASLCEEADADVDNVLGALKRDHRIGPHYLKPGPGWGGSCLPKDVDALLNTGADLLTVRAARETNEAQIERILSKARHLTSGLNGAQIAVWGATFKAGTDDVRDSPAVTIMDRLMSYGAVVRWHDPKARPLAGIAVRRRRFDDPVAACVDADLLMVLTEWSCYPMIDPWDVAAVIHDKAVVDARNVLDPIQWRASGFSYMGVGR